MTYIVPANHPAIAGHFPGNPIVPGAVILSYLAEHARQQGIAITGIKRSKFLLLLKPTEPFLIELDAASGKFTIAAGDEGSRRVIAKGVVLLGDADGG